MTENKKSEKKTEEKTRKEIVPPLEFSSLILPFFTEALINMEKEKNPVTNKVEKNLELAKRMIDLLDLLKERTKGNLKKEEQAFLDHCLQQLKIVYMDEAEIIKL